MTHHVVYHADVDGILCAALYLRYKINKPINYRLYPMMSYSRGDKFKDFINGITINETDEFAIFDYENHALSTFWVDHHPNKDLGHKPVSNDEAVYNPSAYSAFQLLFNYLKKIIPECNDNKFLPSIADDVNMIDSALYKDVNSIFTNTSPIMMIRAYLEKTYPSNDTFNLIVNTLSQASFDLNEAVEMLGINPSIITELRSDVTKAKQYMEVYNKVSLIRQKRVDQFPRYAENFIRPDVKYNVRVSAVGGKRWHLQVGYNQWYSEKNDLHIGKFLANLDYTKGGGHYNVGGGFIKADTIDEFEEKLNTFMDDFLKATHNYEEEKLEKYGVDQNEDKFEKDAQELVKTGQAETIDEARIKVKGGLEGGTTSPDTDCK